MIFKKLFRKESSKKRTHSSSTTESLKPHPTFPSLNKNLAFIKETFADTDDLGKREIQFNGDKCVVMYIETIADDERLQNEVISPLKASKTGNIEEALNVPKIINSSDLNYSINKMLQGYCMILLEKQQEVFLVDIVEKIHRDVDEPETESIVRGAHDGFIESLDVNLNLIRKRIENRKLAVKYYITGSQTNTKLALVYMSGLANPEIVKEIEKRIKSITIDTVINPGFTEEMLEDNPWSIFPQILSTERPDRVEAQIMEGRVAIFLEGSPTCLVLPVTFFSFYQSADDYNSRWWMGTFFRLLRLASFIIAIALPAFYIAVISFHFEVIPPLLTYQVKKDVENIPFPPIIEAFILELTIELIREAGIRLPHKIGPTIGIVGGLVIGDAIVKAGLVSNLMIIVVALTALSAYIVPTTEMSNAIRLIRFPIMIAAATLGFLGIVFSLMFLLVHLCKLHSLKTPYLAPLSPMRFKDIKDTFIRLPLWMFKTRPLDSHPKELKLQGDSREWKTNNEPTEK